MFHKILSLFCFLCLLTSCSPKMRITPGQLPAVQPPQKQLRTQAEGYVKSYLKDKDYKEIKSGRQYRRLVAIIDKLSKAAGYPRKTFPVHLIDAGSNVNASAWNGASIVVYLELMKRVKSDEELATVLGHEIGHIMAEHYKDQKEEKTRASAVGIGSTILGTAASVAASAAGLGAGTANMAGDLTESASSAVGYGAFVGSFNRTQEYEADHLGLLIMAEAGYDPKASARFWDRSAEVFGSSDSSLGAFFSTHPASADRRKALNEAMPYALERYKKKK